MKVTVRYPSPALRWRPCMVCSEKVGPLDEIIVFQCSHTTQVMHSTCLGHVKNDQQPVRGSCIICNGLWQPVRDSCVICNGWGSSYARLHCACEFGCSGGTSALAVHEDCLVNLYERHPSPQLKPTRSVYCSLRDLDEPERIWEIFTLKQSTRLERIYQRRKSVEAILTCKDVKVWKKKRVAMLGEVLYLPFESVGREFVLQISDSIMNWSSVASCLGFSVTEVVRREARKVFFGSRESPMVEDVLHRLRFWVEGWSRESLRRFLTQPCIVQGLLSSNIHIRSDMAKYVAIGSL